MSKPQLKEFSTFGIRRELYKQIVYTSSQNLFNKFSNGSTYNVFSSYPESQGALKQKHQMVESMPWKYCFEAEENLGIKVNPSYYLQVVSPFKSFWGLVQLR